MKKPIETFPEAFSIEGQTALVTGGGSGIGFSIAKSLISAGATVAICGRRKDVLESAAEKLGGRCHAFQADVTKTESLPDLLDKVESTAGHLDILVNNAGTYLRKPALEQTVEEIENILRIHVFASLALSREAAGRMVPRGRGNIIFIGSIATLMALPETIGYSAAKTAVLGATRTLATEWSPHGLRVNLIAPGWINTGMAEEVLAKDPARREKILSRTPLNSLGLPEDIGWAAVYLCSPAARFVTGSTLVVDGGASIGF